MRILLLGASGLVGGRVLAALLADPRCGQVLAPSRRPLAVSDGRLHNPVFDFAQLPSQAAQWQVDAAICALGSTLRQAGSREAFRQVDHDYPLQAAQALRRQGTRGFVLNSALGADPDSRFFYNRVKGELERDLRALGFESLTLVRPGLIGGQRQVRRPGEHLAGQLLGVLGPLLPRRYRINPAERIAAAMVEAALQLRPGVRVIDSAQLA